jgi:hypothetical protein
VPYSRVVEDSAADRNQVLERLLALRWIVAVTPMEHPRGPLVLFFIDAHIAEFTMSLRDLGPIAA